jgi:hypothetical protein
MTKVRHSDLLNVRCAQEIVDRVGQAAARQYMKPSEWIRRAVLAKLEAERMMPADRA